LWEDPDASLLAFTLGAVESWEADLHVIMNMGKEAVELFLPELPGLQWYRAIDTAGDSPEDILPPQQQAVHGPVSCEVASHSVVVFEGR